MCDWLEVVVACDWLDEVVACDWLEEVVAALSREKPLLLDSRLLIEPLKSVDCSTSVKYMTLHLCEETCRDASTSSTRGRLEEEFDGVL